MEVKNKKIGVIGMARSGIAAANFLFERGADVSICDQKSRAELLDQVRQLHPGIQTVFETTAPAPDSTLVALSPGVDINSPALASAKERGVEIISELELAFRFNDAPVIAVTGTNGKSATTTLIGEILQNAGMDIAVGGNIGTPFISLVHGNEKKWMVLEVSSFQLEAIDTFRPRIALILNISPDHLDRHKTLDRYIALKENIAVNQTEHDFLILNHDDPITRSLGDGKKARKFYFSAQAKIQDGAFIENGSIRT
ncbi:MAG: UDP-N-acetylmuramoyl-L-alanine--D-glutamate ligase, partial [Nitrospinae bacterium]|nr:UDP-N-acetylmuramoyl-L-alanine--D-glutamate ligase [Nitrospinota bacterium]